METDRAFAEIFGHRPDWLALVAGREFPLAASAHPGVFKPKMNRLCFSAISVRFSIQRFRSKSPEDVRAMIGELLLVEETRAGRELIERATCAAAFIRLD